MVRRLFAFTLSLALCAAAAADELPENLGLGLRGLVAAYESGAAMFRSRLDIARTQRMQIDDAQRAVVNIHLEGSRPASDVAADLKALGVEVLHVDTHWRKGVISARLPLEVAEAAARMPGLRSVMLSPRPVRRVGSVTAESSEVNRAAPVNLKGLFSRQGILGTGISVGVVSDSYDAAPNVKRAAEGVASGDLPGAGNPNGYTQPVVVIDDNFAPNGGQTDEGRAMAEIVHDIAPGAKLAFSTVQQTQSIMAFSIRNLRANEAAQCDIIVDDIFFLDEPFFSDGQLALAVEDVVNGTTLPGKKVVYFSAAGNEGNYGYSSDLRPLRPAQGIVAPVPEPTPGATPPRLRWEQVPAELYAGGFHNINPSGAPAVAMPIESANFELLLFQWNDPFDAKAITTDYNVLVFDPEGDYLGGFSGVDNNVATDEPLEIALLLPGTTYVVIALAQTPAPVATHFQFIALSEISSPYIAYEEASIVGHAAARSANAVGAYVYNTSPRRDPNYNAGGSNPPPGPYIPGLEEFTSNGGLLPFYFDAEGRRLPAVELRAKPEFAAADGVDTTFFGSDYDRNGFPNFFGTSAAAPTAAGIAALMLEAAGGPGKLTAAQIRSRLQQTTIPHDLEPFYCEATAARGNSVVTVSAHGNHSARSAKDPNFFRVTFTGNPGETLNGLEIDLTNADLVFDDNPSTGYPFSIGSNPNNVAVVSSMKADRRILVLEFANFVAGSTLTFGIDRDIARTNMDGKLADLLGGAEIRATINGAQLVLGAFANTIGRGFSLADGYGLVDAKAAVESILGKRSTSTGRPINVSTRAFSGTGDNVLIGGFVVQVGSKRVIVRALAPSLVAAGVGGVMADPVLTLYDVNGTAIAGNNNWQENPSQAGELQGRGFAPNDPRESAIVLTLPPGNYTGIVRGIANTDGVALVEVYDTGEPAAAAQLANVSSRGLVLGGDAVMIGGFVVSGGNAADVVVRALGPSLGASGVGNVLADPELTLHDGYGNLILTNDNWQQNPAQAAQITGAGFQPPHALESAAAITLPPGAYTAIVRGGSGSTGVGLVEMYRVP